MINCNSLGLLQHGHDEWQIIPSIITPLVMPYGDKYGKISNIRCTKYENLSDCRLVLQLSLANPLEPGVKLRMKM